jgi:quinol monooxygenase YgiN
MYGYTVRVPAPIEAYQATHQAVVEVVNEEGGGEGLLLHLAYGSDGGFTLTEVWESKEHLDAFNRDVLPKAMARAGIPTDGAEPELVEFTPVGVLTPHAFTTDAVS